jgi:hypothetical protein
MSQPGDRLRALAANVIAREVMTGVIDPVISDLQHEYREALEQNRMWRAAWVRLAGYAAFAKVLILCEWSEQQIGLLMRAAIYSLAVTVAVTAVVMYPAIASLVTHANLPDPWRLWMSLVPHALVVAIPPGTALGVTIALAGRQVSRRLAVNVGALALVCSLVSFINIAWVVPEANQRFRAAVAATVAPGHPAPPRGENELTLPGLNRRINEELKGDSSVGGGHNVNLRRLQFAYWSRIAYAFANMALLSVALALFTIAERRWTVLLTVFLAAFGHYVLVDFGRSTVQDSNVPVILAAWLPNVVMVSIAGLVMKISFRAGHADGHSRGWSS